MLHATAHVHTSQRVLDWVQRVGVGQFCKRRVDSVWHQELASLPLFTSRVCHWYTPALHAYTFIFFWGVYTHTHTHVHSLKRGQRYCVLHRDAVIGYMYMSLSCIHICMQLCVHAHGRLRTRARTHIRTRARVHLKIDA